VDGHALEFMMRPIPADCNLARHQTRERVQRSEKMLDEPNRRRARSICAFAGMDIAVQQCNNQRTFTTEKIPWKAAPVASFHRYKLTGAVV
jgi:hypothetical protein